MLSVILKEPKMNTDVDWLFPKLYKTVYIVSLVGVLICTTILFVMNEVELLRTATPMEFLGGTLLSIVKLFAIIIFEVLALRIGYELGILIFRIFESQRETINVLNVIRDQNQYMCEALAVICEKMSKDL